jgi:hypothetical protein
MKESQIQKAVEQYLTLLENSGKLVFIKNNSGAFINPKGNFYKMGKSGSPDFLLFLKYGDCLHLEIKNETYKQTPNQIDYQKKVEKLGHTYIIMRAVDDLDTYLKENNLI